MSDEKIVMMKKFRVEGEIDTMAVLMVDTFAEIGSDLVWDIASALNVDEESLSVRRAQKILEGCKFLIRHLGHAVLPPREDCLKFTGEATQKKIKGKYGEKEVTYYPYVMEGTNGERYIDRLIEALGIFGPVHVNETLDRFAKTIE